MALSAFFRNSCAFLAIFAAGLLATNCRSSQKASGDQPKVGIPEYHLGETLDFTLAVPNVVTESGWAGAEAGWGNWSIAKESVLAITIPEAVGKDVIVDADLRAFTPLQRPRFETKVSVNGSVVATWEFTDVGRETVERKAEVPKSLTTSPTFRITLASSDPRSPSEFGINSDTRKLSLALVRLTIRAR